MVADKIDKKYHLFIWIFLVFSGFVGAIYEIYANVVTTTDPSRLDVMMLILDIILDGAMPTLFTFLGALIVYTIGFRRYARAISRRDFCYIIMFATACVQTFVGLIEAFSILEPDIYPFTSSPISILLLTGAFIFAYFAIVKYYRFNPVEAHNAYKMWFTVYMVVLGLMVLGDGLTVLLVTDNSEMGELLRQQLLASGMIITEIDVAATITTVAIYVAYLAAVIAIGLMLGKRARQFRDPATRERFTAQRQAAPRSYTDVFGEDLNADPKGDDNDKSDNVFDEFGI